MDRFLRLHDTVHLQPLQSTPQNRLYFKDTLTTQAPYLLIRVAASHAGRLTSNNAFYPPQRMQAAIPTFIQPYQKPFLLNHNLEGDPLGRIISARYVDLTVSQPHLQPVRDLLMFQQDDLAVFQLIDILGNQLIRPDFPGLGYAEIIARISSREAIERILDGRYQTVSVAFVTDQAICSICRTDWLQDGKCEHTPGKMVDDKPCFIIVGNMRFDEVSFVNRPADSLAGVLEINVGNVVDQVQVPPRPTSEVLFDAFVSAPQMLIHVADAKGTNLYHLRPNLEEVTHLMNVNNTVADTDIKAREILAQLLDRLQDPDLQISSLADQEMVVQIHDLLHAEPVIEPGTSHDLLHQKLHQYAQQEGFANRLTDAEQDHAHSVEAGDQTTQTPDIRELFDEEKCWEAMNAELEAMAAEIEEQDAGMAQQLRDAKLTTEQRKRLKPSVFCGPDRSFPVPDCAHVTAARRLIHRYKGEGDKEAIMRCVERKAKAMKCDQKKEDVLKSPSKDMLLAQRQELLECLQAVEDQLQQRFQLDFTAPCQGCLDKEKAIQVLQSAAAIDLQQLEAMELDLQAAEEEALLLRQQLMNLMVNTIIDQRQLQARRRYTDDEREKLYQELSGRSLESLSDTLCDQQGYVQYILQALENGMVHQPTETHVADPTLATQETNLQDADQALKARIMHQYNLVSRMSGRLAAQDYLKEMSRLYPHLGINLNNL